MLLYYVLFFFFQTRSKTSVHGRQNKLPPRLIKKRESDRLFSSKTECQLPAKTEGGATDSVDASITKTQSHSTFSTKGSFDFICFVAQLNFICSCHVLIRVKCKDVSGICVLV